MPVSGTTGPIVPNRGENRVPYFKIHTDARSLPFHFIGIGGISMSGLAEILLGRGFHITGSDSQDSALLTRLRNKGAEIFIGQSADNIKNDCEAVVYTAAIHPDNPEFVAAKEAGIPMLSRADLLGEIMQNYRVSIAVAGTHGKTTTTSMASHVLLAADMDPTISVGGILQSIHGNIRVGEWKPANIRTASSLSTR